MPRTVPKITGRDCELGNFILSAIPGRSDGIASRRLLFAAICARACSPALRKLPSLIGR